MMYGYKQALQIIKPYIDKYDRIIFTDKLGQPYIFTLFYYQVDPTRYQFQANLIQDPPG